MNRLLAITVAVLAALLPAQAPPSSPQRSTAAVEEREAYTTERLDAATMRRLLRQLIPAMESDRIDEAERMFAVLLELQVRWYGEVSLEVGDHLAAFGVTLFHTSQEPDVRRRAIEYLRRAVDTYSAHFGRQHREVALALSDFGNAHLQLAQDDPPREAEEALEEAHRIRLATLGATNVETASSLARLAQVKGLPSRTGGVRARIEESAALFRQAIEDFGTQIVVPSGHGAVTTLFELASMYRANALPAEALAAGLEAHRVYRREFRGNSQICDQVVGLSRQLAVELTADRHDREARRLDRGADRIRRGCESPAVELRPERG